MQMKTTHFLADIQTLIWTLWNSSIVVAQRGNLFKQVFKYLKLGEVLSFSENFQVVEVQYFCKINHMV